MSASVVVLWAFMVAWADPPPPTFLIDAEVTDACLEVVRIGNSNSFSVINGCFDGVWFLDALDTDLRRPPVRDTSDTDTGLPPWQVPDGESFELGDNRSLAVVDGEDRATGEPLPIWKLASERRLVRLGFVRGDLRLVPDTGNQKGSTRGCANTGWVGWVPWLLVTLLVLRTRRRAGGDVSWRGL